MLENPIDVLDDFLELVTKQAALAVPTEGEPKLLKGTQKKELELWHTWNNNGRKPEDLAPLHSSYKSFIEHHIHKSGWRRTEIPTSTIHAEYNKHFVDAVKTYNPAKGAQLSTWVENRFKKVGRYVRTYQNVGKMSEGDIQKITEFKEAKSRLSDKLGHEPDSMAIADHLGWSKSQVVRLQKGLREDLAASQFVQDPAEFLHPRELEAIKLMQYDLTPEERTVYEYTFGMNGKPMLQPKDIIQRTKISGPKVSRIRNKLRTKLNETLEIM